MFTLGINSRIESIDYISIVLYGDVTIGAYVDDRGIMSSVFSKISKRRFLFIIRCPVIFPPDERRKSGKFTGKW